MRSSVDVHNFLLERDAPHELVPLQGRPRSPERVAAVLGLPAAQVGHVVLFSDGEQTVAALVPAGADASPSRLAGILGCEELRPVEEGVAADLTGFLLEGMPPAALPDEVRVVMDRTLADEEILYFFGGEVTSVLKIRPADLVRATGATVAPITA